MKMVMVAAGGKQGAVSGLDVTPGPVIGQ